MISVIVPVYNKEKYLSRCLNSILLQTYQKFELIVVDDGSTNSSANIYNEFKKKDSRIKVIHKHNGEVGFAKETDLTVSFLV